MKKAYMSLLAVSVAPLGGSSTLVMVPSLQVVVVDNNNNVLNDANGVPTYSYSIYDGSVGYNDSALSLRLKLFQLVKNGYGDQNIIPIWTDTVGVII